LTKIRKNNELFANYCNNQLIKLASSVHDLILIKI